MFFFALGYSGNAIMMHLFYQAAIVGLLVISAFFIKNPQSIDRLMVYVKPDNNAHVFYGVELNVELDQRPMLNHKGEYVRFSDLIQQPTLLSFGFSQCANACPIIIQRAKNILQQTNNTVGFAFISVDPDRDSIERLSDYLSAFKTDAVVGIQITDKQHLLAVSNQFKHRLKLAYGDNTPQHQDTLYLLHPHIEGVLAYPAPKVSQVLDDLSRLEQLKATIAPSQV